jgi:hypothetical protein
LTTSNRVSYQNALSPSNAPFAKVCGSILTNYSWKEVNTEGSVDLALREHIPLQQTFFGIDVWAQNTTSLAHPRTTYPEYGGGGTNTGVAVAKLAELGLSAGVFAPAWSFEHFPGHGRAIERAIWEGTDLPKDIECSCGNCTLRHRSNKDIPMTKFAKAFTVGTETYFFSNFRRAFTKHGPREKEVLFKGFDIHSQLGSQSPLPLPACSDKTWLSHRLEEAIGQPYLAIEFQPSDLPPASAQCFLPLFNLDMPADNTLNLQISYTNKASDPRFTPNIYLRTNITTHTFLLQPGHNIQTLTTPITSTASVPQRLCELGVQVPSLSLSRSPTTILHIHSILIASATAFNPPPPSTFNVSNFSLTSHTHPRLHTRLHWTYTSANVPGLPWSALTGAFENFEVCVNGFQIGRVGACECIIPEGLTENGEVEVEVKGWGYNGAVLAVGRGKAKLGE